MDRIRASQEGMRLVVGLGNPGERYAATRHNIGFRVVERLAAGLGRDFRPGPGFEQAEADLADGPLVLLKPMTYMNLSGEALAAWRLSRGLADDPGWALDLPMLVVCDDLNLPLGSVRLRAGGGSGGQNGLASILEVCGTERIARLRLGIAPLEETVPPEDWADFVLTEFADSDRGAVEDLVEHAAAAVRCWWNEGLEAAVSRFNRRIRPEAPPGDEEDGTGRPE